MSKSIYPSFIKTFSAAFNGIWQVVRKEKNIKIHLVAAAITVILGWRIDLSRLEWVVIILVISVVLAAEIFNSAVEQIGNLLREKLKLDYSETKLMRDISAGAVLLLAVASVIIGLIIFVPHLLSL